MAWAKGQSGNPAGRPRTGTTLGDQLRAALTIENRAALAGRLVSIALHGEPEDSLRAIKLIFDRVDGPVLQRVQLEDLRDKAREMARELGVDESQAVAEAEKLLKVQ